MTMAMTIGVGGVLPRAARAPRASTLAARAPVCAQAAKRKGFGKKPAKPAKKSAPAEPAYDPKNPLGLTTVEQVPRVGAQQPAGDAQEAEREVRGGRASLQGTLRARRACLVLRAWPLTRICVLARAGTC
uniref:Uncharacterized protein n=1 Tax=Prasinoderma coloniale TaxID=156133 RepID=A0A7R9TC27_9VIRI|mmetsp:Transcript_12231/g.51517  ORF Transcript_12231/g.51517 Transcript_12231/m.51517 type:complete len:130 (+) Transcript_12231:163-552(+)